MNLKSVKSFGRTPKLDLSSEEIYDSNNTYSCFRCEKSLLSMKALKVHLRSHEIQFEYCCLMCDSTFQTLSALSIHNNRHCETPESVCAICGKSYYEGDNFMTHMMTHIDDATLTVQQKLTQDAFINEKLGQVREFSGTWPFYNNGVHQDLITYLNGNTFTFPEFILRSTPPENLNNKEIPSYSYDYDSGNAELGVTNSGYLTTTQFYCMACKEYFVTELEFTFHNQFYHNSKEEMANA